jgi:hypothetical protein
MSDLNVIAVVAAAAAAFVTSTVWYVVVSVPQRQPAGAGPAVGTDPQRPPAWKMLVEFARSLTVAAVVAGIVGAMQVTDWFELSGLAVAFWLAFPVVLLVGSVIWEHVPWRVAASHGGDWLVKLAVITSIVGAWG